MYFFAYFVHVFTFYGSLITRACVAARVIICKLFFFPSYFAAYSVVIPGIPSGDRGNWG